ncbi:hypothetical protein [Deferrisoma sp.]
MANLRRRAAGALVAIVLAAWGGPAAAIESQDFQVAPPALGSYETGATDDGDGVREAGEGEFVSFTAFYDFGNEAGSWTGTTYTDDFGGLSGETLVPGTLRVVVDEGTPQEASFSVPSGSITRNAGGLAVDFGFLAGESYLNYTPIAFHTLTITYQTTVPDADLGGAISRDVTHTAALAIGGGATYSQTATFTAARAAASLDVDVPSGVEVCGEFDATLTVGNATAHPISNVLLTLDTSGDYEYLTPQTPTYGGAFQGSVDYRENAGADPTWELLPAGSDLTADGTVFVRVRRRAGAGTSPTPLAARVDHDDEETSVSAGRGYTATGSGAPTAVRSADLAVTAPASVTVSADRVEWTVTVDNTGDGTAYGAALAVDVPAGLAPNLAETDARNPGLPAALAGQTLSWDLGDLASGGSASVTVVADVAGTACSVGSATATATWGCGGETAQTATGTTSFTFPAGNSR